MHDDLSLEVEKQILLDRCHNYEANYCKRNYTQSELEESSKFGSEKDRISKFNENI